VEPIDLGTVNESGEHSSSDSELWSDWRESEGNVQVSSDSVHEELEQIVCGVWDTLTLGSLSHFSEDSVKFLLVEELWNPSRRKHIIDVDQELLLRDLTVSQNEQKFGVCASSLGVHSLNVSLQVFLSVVGGHNDSEDVLLE
jgi:hypothetical protein